MNSLQRIGTTNAGNPLLWYPFDGVLYYFEAISRDSIRLHAVDTVEGAETDCTEFTPFHELPKKVRAAVVTSEYRMRNTVTEAVEAM